jgi:phage nucleotide-binding protein
VKIRTTKEQSQSTVKMLIYGESGAGKTSLAATLSEPTLIISSEAGLLCLANKEKAIDVIDISKTDDDKVIKKEMRINRLLEAYTFVNQPEVQKKYKWLFIDSLTEISQNLIEALYREFPDRKDSLVMYSENAKRMRGLIKSFRDIPHYNVVFTALPAVNEDENHFRFTSISMVGKAVASVVPAMFDEVFYLDVIESEDRKEQKRVLLTQKKSTLVCKDRSGMLDEHEPANLDHIAKKIRGGQNV